MWINWKFNKLNITKVLFIFKDLKGNCRKISLFVKFIEVSGSNQISFGKVSFSMKSASARLEWSYSILTRKLKSSETNGYLI